VTKAGQEYPNVITDLPSKYRNMKNKPTNILNRPPKLHPFSAFAIGVVCILAGLMIHAAIGGALVGGGIGCLLMGFWDTFRIKAGLVRKSSEESTDDSELTSTE